MGQDFQLDQDLLSFETFLVPFAGRQALFILLDLDFHATTAFIVEVDISQQDYWDPLPLVRTSQSTAVHL